MVLTIKKMKLWKNQKGLTLIELLAVIVILGIIAAIAVPAIGGIITKSKKDADESSIIMIKEAAELYMLGNQDAKPQPTLITLADLEAKGYLKAIPKVQGVANSKFSDVGVSGTASGWSYTVTIIPSS